MQVNRSSNPAPDALLLGLVAWLATLVACASTPDDAPLPLPAGLSVGIRYHAGGIVAGPQADAPDAAAFAPEASLALRCQVLYVEGLPVEGVEPLESLARFVALVEEGEPIVPHAPFLRTAGLAEGAAADTLRADLAGGRYGRTVTAADLRGALPEGATAVIFGNAIERALKRQSDEERELATNVLGLHVARGGASIELALGLRDASGGVPLGPEAAEPEGTAPPYELRHELVLLRAMPLEGAASAALVIPSPFQASAGQSFVVFLELRDPPGESADAEVRRAHAVASDEVREEVEASAQRVAELAHVDRVDVAVIALMRAVLEAQRPGNIDEQAMFGLASAVQAWLTCDLLLVCGEAELDRLVETLGEEMSRAEQTFDSRAAFGWLLDRSTWRVVAEDLLEGEGELVIDSIALRHAGELGRYPASILEGVENAADSAAFKRYVLQENLAFLSDSHPSARLRAWEWLQRNATVPENYDPLADNEARHAALTAFYEALREDTARESTAPEDAP